MDTALEHTLSLLETYRYEVLFPITLLEGPVATIIAGMLISLGYFDPVIACIIMILADSMSDVFRYYLGLSFRNGKVEKLVRFFGISQSKTEQFGLQFNKHPKKLIFSSKIFPGIGMAIQVAAGAVKSPLKEYFWITFVATVIKTIILTLVGYAFGSYINQMNDYFSVAGLILALTGVAVISSFYFLSKYGKSHTEE
jgi:membrane protein DedA with SNARE-associated domain